MIRLSNVSKHYDGNPKPSLLALSLEIAESEVVALIGESGCGKTTTLKLINRLIEPSAGEISVGGDDVRSVTPYVLRRRIGYVFQGIGLFPHYSIAENVAAVPRLLQWEENRIHARVDEMLSLVGLEPRTYRDRPPAALSGGQQQRVGVARALAAEPRVMLLDEPFGALDPITRAELQEEFLRIQKSLQLTALLVTHDVTEALLLADRIAVMRDGELLQCGTARTLRHQPQHEYVARLLSMPKKQADRVEALLDGGPEDGP